MLQSKKKDKQGNPIQRDWTAEEEQIAAKEEEQMVDEFATKLAHNLGMVNYFCTSDLEQ